MEGERAVTLSPGCVLGNRKRMRWAELGNGEHAADSVQKQSVVKSNSGSEQGRSRPGWQPDPARAQAAVPSAPRPSTTLVPGPR